MTSGKGRSFKSRSSPVLHGGLDISIVHDDRSIAVGPETPPVSGTRSMPDIIGGDTKTASLLSIIKFWILLPFQRIFRVDIGTIS